MSESNELSKRNAAIQEMFTDGKKIRNFYRFTAQNPHINLHDACQIIINRPNATVCFSFEEWNAMGRRITRGRNGIPYFDNDTAKRFVFDASDTHGDNRYQRLIYPMRRLLIGLDELTGVDTSSMRDDYQRIFSGVALYLKDNGYLTADEQRNILLAEGTAYSLYCKTGFPKNNGITLHGYPYSLKENADLFRDIYVTTDALKNEIEDAYIRKQNEVKVIDDTEEDVVSDEPVITHTEQVEQAEEHSAAETPKPSVSPMYEQYSEVQKKYPDSVIAMRLGDFYEVMGEKAKVVADELDLTLTGRNVGLDERVPMCGYPYHVSDVYTEKILEKHSVVILENGEEFYIESHAEALGTKPQLVETEEESPFDDEQPDYVGDIDTRFPIDDDYSDEDEQETDEYDGEEDEEDLSEQDESEKELSKPKEGQKSRPIQDRKHKPKPQMSFFDLLDTDKKPEEQVKEWALKYGSENKYVFYEQYATNPDEREFIDFVKKRWGTSYGAYLGDREFQCTTKGVAAAFKDREHPENNVGVKLTWAQYAIGIADLIDEGNYFTPEEKETYDKFYAERRGSNEERIKAIADHAIERGLKHDDGGIYDMWESWMYAGPLFFKEHRAEIEAELNSRNEILNATCVDGKISMMFDHEYLSTKESGPQTDTTPRDLDAEEDEDWDKLIESGVLIPTELKSDEERIQALADFMVDKGSHETTEGNYIFYFDDIPEDKQFIYDHAEAIRDEIASRDEVADVYALGDVDGDCFDITYYLDYCPNLDEAVVEDVYGENTDLNSIGFDQSELGGAKARFKGNLEAIRLLNSLYDEDRLANGAERKVLAKYVGWGGIPQAFDERDENWRKEYAELKMALSTEDYERAKGSVLNAHYTSKEVIDGMYAALARFGVKGNNRILEPAMGTGNFFGYMPQDIRSGAGLYGVEIDNITGKIAAKLYPEANVQIKGFEQTTFPNNYFDVVVGNVPFGNYGVYDSEYAKQNFYIHDYFLAKSIDKLRENGVMAVITSKGTMDKLNPSVRKYLADRAELLGAIRLPDTAFKQTANTRVVADILFFRKREEKINADTENTEWLSTGKTEQGYEINNYFIKHPEMILGTLALENRMYGALDVTVQSDGRDLTEALQEAITHLPEGFYQNPEHAVRVESKVQVDYDIKPLCLKAENGKVYMRVGEEMVEQTLPKTPKDAYERVSEMINLRSELRHILEMQTEGCSDEKLQDAQRILNANYDHFVKRFGFLNSQTNTKLFKDDADSALLFACEEMSDDKKTATKADIFSKRTIRPYVVVTQTDDSFEALQISKNERGAVDISYIEELTGKDYDTVVSELGDSVFRNPAAVNPDDKYTGFETAEEYLSGNVVHKLNTARNYATAFPDMGYEKNVAALEAVQPEPIKASDIGVRIGASWIDTTYYKQFLYELLGLPRYYPDAVQIYYNRHDSSWRIDRTGYIRGFSSMKVDEVYGTSRANAYRLFEDCLNLRATTIYDTIRDSDGKEKRVLNQAETIAARDKQNQIKEAFKEWIFADPDRREELERVYNSKFNQTRLPAYDGSYLRFPEMNPEIELKPHQKNAVHRIITSGNTLLHHVVGSGKTFTICASIMKLRQYGLAKKPMIAVPNHLVQQWAGEFRKLYPNAKLLIASKEDLEKENRQKFVSRVAMGDWDAIIIAQSSFAKIPISKERQERKIREEISRIEETIERTWDENDMPRGAVKNLEKIKKNREAQLKKLLDDDKKDNVLIFESLGVDYLFIDEAHYYKNKFLFTKMNNVAGISTAASQRASDLEMKCEYINELHDGDVGVVFATGTPISNSMTEMFTMQSYLQQRTLEELGITYFDGWAADFGETVTSLEMTPSGQGYKAKTRFSKFTNLPELLTMYRSFADVQTSDMVKLDVPDAERKVITLKPSDTVLNLADEIAERAEKISMGGVPPEIDNMLKVTSDGKKLALDPRCFDKAAADEGGSKINECANRIFEIWEDTQKTKGTQIVFCDLSTPKCAYEDYEYGKDFDVYNDLKYKLVQMGIPKEQIAYIHDANSDLQKQALFDKVNAGTVRVLIGSTEKCGAGTNVQERLVALHHLDTPYRPSDMQQREGRIIRQGNTNKEVQLYTYVTERTFDSYSYQILENKQRFISQIDKGDLTVREAEDIDETTLTYAEIKAITAANPKIKRKMEVDTEIARLRVLEGQYKKNLYALQDKIRKTLPEEIRRQTLYLERLRTDIATVKAQYNPDVFSVNVLGKEYTDKKEGGQALMDALMRNKTDTVVAEYAGFKISLDPLIMITAERSVTIAGAGKYTMDIGQSASGLLTRLENFFTEFPKREERAESKLRQLEGNLEVAKQQVEKPFEHADRLRELVKEQGELNAELDLNKREEVIIDEEKETEIAVTETSDDDNFMAIPEANQTQTRARTKRRKSVTKEMLKLYEKQKSEKPQGVVFMQNGDYYEMYGEEAERIADEYELPLIVDADVDKILSVDVGTLDEIVRSVVGKGGVIRVIEPQIEQKENNILENNDTTDERMLERRERLSKFVEEGLANIKWLNGRVGGFTDDEIDDLTNDLKEHFEGSEFYAEAGGMPYDDWYDLFVEDELKHVLEERKAIIIEDKPDYELVTKNGYRIESLYTDGERKYAIFHRESDNTYGVALGYDTETGEWGQGHYDFKTYMAAFVDIPKDDEKRLEFIFPKNKTRRELVSESVEREYQQFYAEEMQKPKEDLINTDNYKIRFYNELSVYLGNDVEYSNLSDRDFEALYYDSPFILDELYDYYLGNEYASINNYGDVEELIRNYNDDRHEETVADRYEFKEGVEPFEYYFGKDTSETAFYYFPDKLSLDTLTRIKEKADTYAIAAPVMYLSDEQREQRHIFFLKTDRDIQTSELENRDEAIRNMQLAMHKVVSERNREFRENLKNLTEIKNDIEKAISDNYDGWHLKEGFEDEIIAKHGLERVQYVLANTVQVKEYDGRFSPANKEWARGFEIKENEGHRLYSVVETHPAVLDGFISRIRNKEITKIQDNKEETKLPENEKTKWIDVPVSRDALIKTYEKHSFMRMPQGEYEEYTYNMFNDRIKKSTMLVDMQSDTRELAYNLRLKEDETVLIKHKTDGEIEFTAAEFKELVANKGSENYIRKNEENEMKWTTIRVPQDAMRGSYEKSTLFAMPQSSDLKGYSFYVPNNFVSEDKDSEDGTIKINVPDDFKFTVSKKEEVNGEEKKDTVKLSAYQMFQRMNGVKSTEFVRGQQAEQAQAAPPDSGNDGWHYVSVDKAAKVAEYEERTLFKMPAGEYQDYCYYIPNTLLRENEEKGTVRVSLPNDFVVSLLNRNAEKEEERKVEMRAEQYIEQVKGKTADDYPSYQKPSETRVDKFAETGKRLIESVPEEMKSKPNWIIVRTKMNEEKGRLDKFLISPITGKFAESDNPATWTDFDTACKYARENGGVALAYALDGKDGIACIDLDGCVDKDGNYTPLANDLISKCGKTYMERSISGNGLHIFGTTSGMDVRTFSKDGDMEFYQNTHFIAMTGDGAGYSRLESFDNPAMKQTIQSKCEKRVAWNGAGAGVEGLSRMSDREVVEKACDSKNGATFKDYYDGKDLKNNHSNSDMAFMNLLAFWCNGDKEQMLRIFATSGLYRADKLPSYYECTAIKAIKDNTERFQPKKNNPVSNKPIGNGSGSSGKGGK